MGNTAEDELVGLVQGLDLSSQKPILVAEKAKDEEPIPVVEKAKDEELIGLLEGLSVVPKLRPYQDDLVSAVEAKFATSKAVLLYLPTGGGKSAICATIAKREVARGNRVGVFVHRDELALQMEASLLKWTQEREIGFIKAKKLPKAQCKIQIVSIQTFSTRYLKGGGKGEDAPEFDLVIIDEAHHAMASEYVQVHKLYADKARLLGVTATPFRLKRGEMLGDIFSESVFGPTMRQLQEGGFLVPFVSIRSSCSQGQVGRKACQTAEVLTAVVLNWKKRHAALKTLAFCVNLAHASQLCDLFEARGVRAAVMSGKDKPAKRESLFEQSRLGEISVLCTVDVVSEGVDTVWIDCLLMLRPTESLGLYLQQLGRGLRPWGADKKRCTVLDEVGNLWDHGFADELDMALEMTLDGAEDKLHRLNIYPCQGYQCRALASKRRNKTCAACSE